MSRQDPASLAAFILCVAETPGEFRYLEIMP